MRMLFRRVFPRIFCPTLLIAMAWTGARAQAGPFDRLRPAAESVERGRSVYAARCINCHGLDVKGTENGPELIRSVAVLRDNEGSAIGPAMAGIPGHPENLGGTELADISHFLRQQKAHWDLLERITDREIHDVVTYLETLR